MLESGPPLWVGWMSIVATAVWCVLAVFQVKLRPTVKESVFLTAKTSAMVCWLFVGSSIFSAAFALLGGQEVVEHWVLSLGLTPLQFMILAQVIIFLLGWPLEWTEIIVIFMPIFIPLLAQVQHRSAVLRPAGRAQPADGVPVAAGGDGGVLSEGRVAAARHAEPDLRRHDAVHGDPGRRAGAAVHLSRDRAVAAAASSTSSAPACSRRCRRCARAQE